MAGPDPLWAVVSFGSLFRLSFSSKGIDIIVFYSFVAVIFKKFDENTVYFMLFETCNVKFRDVDGHKRSILRVH